LHLIILFQIVCQKFIFKKYFFGIDFNSIQIVCQKFIFKKYFFGMVYHVQFKALKSNLYVVIALKRQIDLTNQNNFTFYE